MAEAKMVNDLILPLARSLAANWNDGNRREAGVALAHIAGCGELAGDAIHAMAKLLKKVRLPDFTNEFAFPSFLTNRMQINPVRFLEAQMACLRLSFNRWLDYDPEELESERATEEELEAVEAKEKEQHALVSLAAFERAPLLQAERLLLTVPPF